MYEGRHKIEEMQSNERLFDMIMSSRYNGDFFSDLDNFKPIIDNLDNLEEGMELLFGHIRQGSKIKILHDGDFDGSSSGVIIYRFIRDDLEYENIDFITHKQNKNHNINIDEISEDTKLLIVPDAGTNNVEEHFILKEKGIDLLILDHHKPSTDKDKKSPSESCAIIINNQMSNKSTGLCGAGVVYRFLEYINDKKQLGINIEKYLDLVAFALIADVMPMNDIEVQYYVQKGLQNINNPMLNYLLDNIYGLNRFELSPFKIAYNVTPVFNGIERIGTYKERQDLFKGLILDKPEIYEFTPSSGRNKGITREENSWERLLRLSNSCRNKQKTLKNKVLKVFKDIDETKKVLIIDADKANNKSVLGMVASGISENNKKCVLVLTTKENNDIMMSGSARAIDGINLKSRLEKSGLFELIEGHEGAFGVEILKDNISKLEKFIEKEFDDLDAEPIKYVDFELTESIFVNISEDLFDISQEIQPYVGKKFDGIKVVIKDLDCELLYKKYDRASAIIFKTDNNEFKLFSGKEDYYNELTDYGFNNEITCDLILELQKNGEYNNANVKDFIIKEKMEEDFEW